MFGYVKPYVPELKVIEDQYYKAAYCGLCRAMKKETGMLSRMTLSYDMTFLVLLRLALTGEVPSFEKKRSFAHPTKKRLVMRECEASRYASHVGMILAWRKISDDIHDEKGFSRIKALFMKICFSSSYKKAKKGYEELDARIKEHLKALHKLEREKVPSADRPAEIFGRLMEDVASLGIENEDTARIARAAAMPIGRFIYLIDALDDMESDRKKKSYNPFLILFDYAELDTEKKLDIKAALMNTIAKASAAIDLMPFEGRRDLYGVINNILSEGLPRMADAVLLGEKEPTNETSNTENTLETENKDERPL